MPKVIILGNLGILILIQTGLCDFGYHAVTIAEKHSLHLVKEVARA
jgi:hypothetical protein